MTIRSGPFSRNYKAAVLLVVLSLAPYLALVAGIFPLLGVVAKSLHLSKGSLELTVALSTGGYAVGTLVAAQLAAHLPPRRLLVAYEAVFVTASVLAAASSSGGVFIVSFVVQGLCTSLMLIAAVPPLVTRWPADKMPTTGAIMNLCIFGAIAAGPSAGALEAHFGQWRPLFWGVAVLSCLALCASLLTYDDDRPQDSHAPWDFQALLMGTGGCAAAFFGAGYLQASGSAGPASLVPLAGGVALIVVLIIIEYRKSAPLVPVRAASSSVPVTGIFIALMTSAASFGIMVLAIASLGKQVAPTTMALYFLPEFAAAVGTAGLFGVLFKTRFTPVLACGGLLATVTAAALLIGALPSHGPLVAVGLGLAGLGVGASVSPALFMVGFSIRSSQLQRVFALIELLRGVTAFLVAPILAFLATSLASTPVAATTVALWICLGIASAGFIGGTAFYLAGKGALEPPDVRQWRGEDEPAWNSPPMLSRLRRSRPSRSRFPTSERGERAA